MYYGRRLVSTGFQSCSEIFQPFLGNCWKYLIDSSVYSCVLQAIFNIFTRIFVFWILKKYKSWLLFSRDLSMYMCNMINRCAPHEKKKRRNQEKNGNSRRNTLFFSPSVTGTAKVTSLERSWETHVDITGVITVEQKLVFEVSLLYCLMLTYSSFFFVVVQCGTVECNECPTVQNCCCTKWEHIVHHIITSWVIHSSSFFLP